MPASSIAEKHRKEKPRPKPQGKRGYRMRKWILNRLREADGVTYDKLCHETYTAFPHRTQWFASVRAVRAVREVLWLGYAVTNPDESVWLTPAGWYAFRPSPKPAQTPTRRSR